MSMAETLQEIDSWPLEDKVELAYRLWDRLATAGWQPELPNTLSAELESRLEDADKHPDKVVTWEDVVAHVRRKK